MPLKGYGPVSIYLETGEGADLLGGVVEEITALLAQGLAAPAIRGRFSDKIHRGAFSKDGT